MPKAKVISSDKAPRKLRPALSPEARENQMISLAMDCAEQQLLDGTASSQVITHYLKLGSQMAKLEMKKIEMETALLNAKKESLDSASEMKVLYTEAMNAMRMYNGQDSDED